ncbi:MAG: TrpR-like protein YerC/YecD [Clostridiales bacterium]|nr:TrpR-like protein YerC/YecD [Clostridiales bacterium]
MFNSKIKNEDIDFLFETILTLKNMDECYRFFEDLCTINEIQSMAQRMQVASMLRKRRTYIDIAHTTGASTATISRVNRSLSYGNEGYKLVFERLRENQQCEE